jgi:MFS family permease
MQAIRAMKSFLIIWAGQSVSLMGSGLTRFALGVWIFEETGSVTQFSLIFLFALLPNILISPLAGTLVDRWPRRHVMVSSDTGAGLTTLALVALVLSGDLAAWHVYLIVAANALFSAFQEPAYAAAMPMLVPKEYLDRANGFVQIDLAISRLIVPAVAGFLFTTIGLQGIMLIDAVTFFFAIITLFLVPFPPLVPTTETPERGSVWQEMAYGWRYLRARPGLMALIWFMTLTFLVMGGATATFTPLVLSVTTPQILGFIWSVAGVGIFISSFLISARGLFKRRIYGVLGFGLLMGLGTAVSGIHPSPIIIGLGLFLVFVSLPVFQASSQTLLQSKVAPDVQGRVFALRNMITTLPLPFVFIFVGSVTDRVLEPWLSVEGALAGSVGRLIGVGAGRGIGFLFVLLGLFLIVVAIGGYLYPQLRLVEDGLPDVVNV